MALDPSSSLDPIFFIRSAPSTLTHLPTGEGIGAYPLSGDRSTIQVGVMGPIGDHYWACEIVEAPTGQLQGWRPLQDDVGLPR